MDELSSALALATDDELDQIADILFRRKFNPIDYFAMPPVAQVQSQERSQLIAAIIERFKFLAADGFTVLKRKTSQVSYRQVLERVCQHLKVKYSAAQTVAEIESELFLCLISRSWQRMSPSEQNSLNASMQSALTESDLQKSLPRDLQRDPISLVLKGGSALAVTTVVKPAVMLLIARQMAWHFATYQVGREALKAGGTAIATRLQAYLSTYLAKRGMVAAATQYTAARTAFALITPALWGLFFADLGWRAIATNYSRIIPVIFTLAQIRLLRDY
ncbi:hypothetical protein V2H45_03835 [Tumidithrix elongata RA019]|uniref:Uncharacterized protein n=1 Tax=Tumidithrix elongata BACA0141 TaxID=2716417 RepID=A0AAW9PWA6_9CYAN|nr:hypothetical protein [Tumidithrix elongata RA019]